MNQLTKDTMRDLLTADLLLLNVAFRQEGHELRFVGGCVRDAILGFQPKDIDLATTATPDEMIKICEKYDYSYIPTGLQHGTLTIRAGEEHYEVTTLRVDSNQDGRHADVDFTRDWETDSSRRDFTINAMYVDFDGNIYDYHYGYQDLMDGNVIFVGDAEQRIIEDSLRIMRAFRMTSRFASYMNKTTKTAISKLAHRLEGISGERIWDELKKIAITGNARALPHC